MTSEKPAKPLVEQTLGEKLEAWFEHNNKWINVLLIVVLAGIGGYKAYEWIHARNVAEASMAYGSALNQYQMAQSSQDPAAAKDQLGGAITAAEQVVAEHGDMSVGREAQLLIGNAQYAMVTGQAGSPEAIKTLEKARDSYRKYIEMASTPQEKATGYLALGNVLENLSFMQSDDKVMQEAIDSYKQALAASEGSYLGSEVKLSLARALAGIKKEKNEAEAAKLLKEVSESKDAPLISAEAIEPVISTGAGDTESVPAEKAKELLNFEAWSHKQLAQDALSRLK